MKVNGDSIPHKRKSTISSRRSSAAHKMKSLPSDFFEKILLLEMEIEEDFSLEAMNQLISLYSVIYSI